MIRENLHSEVFVKKLFDEMSKTYGIVHLFSSLGFAYLWRKQAVNALPRKNIQSIADLMTGGAECLPHIHRRYGLSAKTDLIDWSENMCAQAGKTVSRSNAQYSNVLRCSALEVPVGNHHYDAVVCTFGLKTLHDIELAKFAKEIRRILKPGGHFSILEFSIPANSFIRFFFRLYVKHYIPFLGRIFLGNPDNYRMLWIYTEKFRNCDRMASILRKEGLQVYSKSYLCGSATHLTGHFQS